MSIAAKDLHPGSRITWGGRAATVLQCREVKPRDFPDSWPSAQKNPRRHHRHVLIDVSVDWGRVERDLLYYSSDRFLTSKGAQQ